MITLVALAGKSLFCCCEIIAVLKIKAILKQRSKDYFGFNSTFCTRPKIHFFSYAGFLFNCISLVLITQHTQHSIYNENNFCVTCNFFNVTSSNMFFFFNHSKVRLP